MKAPEASQGSPVQVTTGTGGGYPVVVGPSVIAGLPDLLTELAPAPHYALISDSQVMGHHGERILALVGKTDATVTEHVFPAGETSKSREEWARLTDELVKAEVGRDGCVVALGGGVTGDLAGFVAATYLRGIPVVQLPTSLVAMIDSAVGGKTGVDLPAGKNLLGAFHPPRFVLADMELARTLPEEERRQGLAEAIKHGAILDESYMAWIGASATGLLAGEVVLTERLVRRSVELKAHVVSADEREGGLREILNFGHTLGHALEAASGYAISHGNAVAMGMVLEAALGEELGLTEPGTGEVLAGALEAVGLPSRIPPGQDPDLLMGLLMRDKKVRERRIRIVFLRAPGEVLSDGAWAHPVEVRTLSSFLKRSCLSVV